jgi:predicted DNA-binding transcriptional regulator AlpA
MSKQAAAEFMNMSIPTFDLHIAKGDIPKGKKRKGFKELVWYKCDLYECLQRLNR